MRDDVDAVQDMLFAAFEKHQYYNIRDLVKITRQPIVSFSFSSTTFNSNRISSLFFTGDCINTTINKPQVYLKEILNEVCNYNLKNPHRNMWELKPEYRHYKDDKPAESMNTADNSDSN